MSFPPARRRPPPEIHAGFCPSSSMSDACHQVIINHPRSERSERSEKSERPETSERSESHRRRSQSGGCLFARKVNTVCVDVFYLRIAVGRGMAPGRGVPPTGRTLLRFFRMKLSSNFFPKSFLQKVFSKKFCQEKFGEGPSGRTGPRLYWLFSKAWLFSKVMVFV